MDGRLQALAGNRCMRPIDADRPVTMDASIPRSADEMTMDASIPRSAVDGVPISNHAKAGEQLKHGAFLSPLVIMPTFSAVLSNANLETEFVTARFVSGARPMIGFCIGFIMVEVAVAGNHAATRTMDQLLSIRLLLRAANLVFESLRGVDSRAEYVGTACQRALPRQHGGIPPLCVQVRGPE